MTPSTIKSKEDSFFSTLKSNAGVKYTLKSTTDIGGPKIYSIRPPYSTYYYQAKTKKTSICLHFTVGYIGSDVSTLSKDGSHVSVSYTVDRCGRIYELFDDSYWSYHLGNAAIGGNGTMSKQSIGIEISNYGPLKMEGPNLIDAYKNVYCKASEKEYYYAHDYRGYKYFASMTPEQIDSIVALIKHLSAKHDIPIEFKMDDAVFNSAAAAQAFHGIYCHTNVRPDKFDWPFCEQIKAIIEKCTRKEPVAITEFEQPQDDPEPETEPEPIVDAAPEPPKAQPKAEPAVRPDANKVPLQEVATPENQSFGILVQLMSGMINILQRLFNR